MRLRGGATRLEDKEKLRFGAFKAFFPHDETGPVFVASDFDDLRENINTIHFIATNLNLIGGDGRKKIHNSA